MQSGISVSQELQSTFKNLLKSPIQRGLLCTISNDESIVTFTILQPATASFSNDLSLLTPHLKANVPLYIILRRYENSSDSPFIFITYVPDAAHVRSKMLFASTRITLVRELGIEHFRETIFSTTPEELTPAGFDKHDQHVQLEAPLTEEERSLGEVKRKEAEECRGMMDRKTNIISSLSMRASDEVSRSLSKLVNSGTHVDEDFNLVQLKIDIETETLELDSQTVTPISQLNTVISDKNPRYSFYRYFHENNGMTCSPTFFIYTRPVASSIKERMLYATLSRTVQNLGQDMGLLIDKKIEGYPSDITEENLRAELYPKVEEIKKFDRPRRPGASRPGR